MSKPASFADLIRWVRAGDQQAAAELVARYEPAIRRAIRFRLTDTRLQATLDSMDICQSVLASFFVRAAAGEYELEGPEQLLRLLLVMARNKLASQVRKQRAARRSFLRHDATLELTEVPSSAASPSEEVAAAEMLVEARRRLTPEERQLVELRQGGMSWDQIAAELGSTATVLRKKLSRALDRVTRELGLEGNPS